MNLLSRRHMLGALAAATALAGGTFSVALAEDKTSVKIGYALSLTGPNAGGTGITTHPNYQLWVKEVNAAGGLEMPDGKRLPIEVIEYDDRSSTEELVRAVQRLATEDKVDFILPPWSTGYNLAAAPLFDRYGYPHLAATSVTDKAPEFAKRWKKSFWLLGGGHDYTAALAKLLVDAADKGTINKKVAMISIADGFGIDLVNAARPSFAEAGLEIVYDKTYPVGTTDFTPMINEAKASGADSFVAFSYPPETFALTQQAQVADFNPKVLYFGVGTAFPIYAKNNGDNINGVMGIGGIDGTSDKIADYRKRHEAATGKVPDYWASVITYASLEILQEAIKRKGLDREAVSAEIASGTFKTVLGETKLVDNQLRDLWWAGQWQNGQFVGIAPGDRSGASQPVIPRQAWKK